MCVQDGCIKVHHRGSGPGMGVTNLFLGQESRALNLCFTGNCKSEYTEVLDDELDRIVAHGPTVVLSARHSLTTCIKIIAEMVNLTHGLPYRHIYQVEDGPDIFFQYEDYSRTSRFGFWFHNKKPKEPIYAQDLCS